MGRSINLESTPLKCILNFFLAKTVKWVNHKPCLKTSHSLLGQKNRQKPEKDNIYVAEKGSNKNRISDQL